MSFIKEFKEFAVKGNVIDLAVGVIIGGAFGKIVTSLIDDLIMPLVARLIGQPDFSNLYVALVDGVPSGTSLEEARKIGPIFAYGNFITVAINFLIMAWIIFLMVKAVNKLKAKQEEAPAPGPSSTDTLLMEIRDQLAKK